MQLMGRFALYYWLVKRFRYKIYNQKVLSSNPREFLFYLYFYLFIWFV